MIESIETAYDLALAAHGSDRLERFEAFSRMADDLAAVVIYLPGAPARYAVGYANLMHNFVGSLASLRMLEQPALADVRERLGAAADRQLVDNGSSAIALLRECLASHHPIVVSIHASVGDTSGVARWHIRRVVPPCAASAGSLRQKRASRSSQAMMQRHRCVRILADTR